MNILVCGAEGFIGKNFIQKFNKSHSLITISHAKAFKPTRNGVALDLANETHVRRLRTHLSSTSIEIVFHFAAATPSNQKPFQDDLKLAKNLVSLVEGLKIPRLVFTSGWVVYDPRLKPPLTETDRLRPTTPYGRTKLNVENFFRDHLRSTLFLNLRLATIYGPGQTSAGLIPNCVRSALKEKKIIVSPEKIRRDYLFIDDLLVFLNKISSTQINQNLTLNLGSGNSYPILRVGQIIKELVENKTKTRVDLQVGKKKVSAPVLQDNCLNINQATKIFGFRPKTNLRTGLSDYINWVNHEHLF